jgi:transcription-repair coupling factor (superfamily II helicase)
MMTVGAARKRISAIKQYSSLGAGFRIAMRDLEIRGAAAFSAPRRAATSWRWVSICIVSCCKQAVAQLKGQKPGLAAGCRRPP